MKEVLSVLNWYSIHPLVRLCKGPDILLELTYVRKNQEFWCGRISSFKSTFLQTLISNNL